MVLSIAIGSSASAAAGRACTVMFRLVEVSTTSTVSFASAPSPLANPTSTLSASDSVAERS